MPVPVVTSILALIYTCMAKKRYQDEEWLRHEYIHRGRTQTEIARDCDVTATTISDWMDRHEIPRRDRSDAQRPDGKHTDREWLAEQYHGKGRSLSDMGEECGVSAATVMKWMDKHDIPRRDSTDHKRKEPPAYRTTPRGYVCIKSKSGGKQYQIRVHQLVAIANGADPERVFSDGEWQCHHRNGVKWDNRPANIELLSQSEHDELHAAEQERAETGEFV